MSALEESKEQLSTGAAPSSPLFHRRQPAPPSSSASPHPSRPSPQSQPEPQSPQPPQPPTAVEDELDSLTAAEIASIPIPTAPSLPFTLTDPLTPPQSPTHSSASSSAASPPGQSHSTSLAALLAPFTSAYDEQRRTLLAGQQSIARLTSLCQSELKAATRAAEKRTLSLLNHTECSGQERKVRERRERGERDKAKMEAELGDSKAKIEAIKTQLATLGASIEKQTTEYCQLKERERDDKERQLDRLKADEDERREELKVIRTKNVSFFMQLNSMMEALNSEESEFRSIEGEYNKMTQLIEYWNEKRTEVNDRKTKLAQTIEDQTRVKHEKDALCDKMQREIREIEAQIVHQQALLIRIVDEAKLVEDEERKEREWIGLVKDENEYNSNEIHTMERVVDMERLKLKEEKKMKRKLVLKRTLLSEQLTVMSSEMDAVETEKTEAEKHYERACIEETIANSRWKSMAKQIEFHNSELKILDKSIEMKDSNDKKKMHLYKLKQSQLHHYQNELKSVLHSIDDLTKQNEDVSREVCELEDKIAHCDQLSTKYHNMNDEIDQLLLESNNELLTLDTKLNDQTSLLETIANDRDNCRKVIVEKTTQLKLNRQSMEIKKREVEEDKKRIYFIEKEMVNLQTNFTHWLTEYNKTTAEDDRLLSKRTKIGTDIKKLTGNLNEITALCTSCTREELAERKQLAAVVGEERVLNVQLVARETESTRVRQELKLLYSKVKQCERSVRNTYQSKLSNMKNLDVLKHNFDEAMFDLQQMKGLKNDISNLECELSNETRKKLALEDESHKRINIHRWRNLRDGRNDKYGLLTRKRDMNNKLIGLVRDIDERSAELRTDKRLYEELEVMYNKMTHSQWMDDERTSVMEECVQRKDKEKMIANQLNHSMDRKKQLLYEVEQLKQRQQMILLQYFSQRSKQDRHTQHSHGHSHKSAVNGATAADSDEEGDDVLKRSSFAAGEVYDADGNRLYEDEVGRAHGGGGGGGGGGGLVDTLVATQVNAARAAAGEEQKEQLS